MVRKILKFFAYVLFFVVALLFFIPKVSLYHFAEVQLKPFGVIISKEKVNDYGFSFEIENASLSMKKIPSAEIQKIDIKFLLLYNNVRVESIKLADAVKSFAPTKIEYVDITYSIFNPLNVVAKAHGDFGVADATINILERKVHVDLKASKLMKKNYRSTLRNLKRTKDGGYTYDQAL